MKRLAIIFVLLAGCGKEPNDAWQGYIEGEYVLLASPYAGQLEKLHVRRGERIETGKPVFTLEQESERAARLEAEERLKAAQARLGNLKVPKRPPEIDIRIMSKYADGDVTLFHSHTIRHPGDPGMNIVDIFRHLPDGKVQEHWEVLQLIPETLPHDNGIF